MSWINFISVGSAFSDYLCEEKYFNLLEKSLSLRLSIHMKKACYEINWHLMEPASLAREEVEETEEGLISAPLLPYQVYQVKGY